MNYIAGDDLITQKVPTHDPVEAFLLRIRCIYDSGAGASVLYDGKAGQVLDNFRVGFGTKWPIKIFGKDLHIVHEWLKRNVVGGSDFTPAVGAGKVADMKFTIPVGLSPLAIPKLSMQVEYGNDGFLGTNQTIISAQVNGRFMFARAGVPLTAYKIFPNTELSNATGTRHIDIPPEGRLNTIIVITRNPGTPFARADLIDDAQLRIEGDEKLETDWEEMQQRWQNLTDDPEKVGVGVLKLDDKPLIGNNSRFEMQFHTPCDATFYYIFESPTAPMVVSRTSPQLGPPGPGGLPQPGGNGRSLFQRIFPIRRKRPPTTASFL